MGLGFATACPSCGIAWGRSGAELRGGKYWRFWSAAPLAPLAPLFVT
jgi:hypothetical protein